MRKLDYHQHREMFGMHGEDLDEAIHTAQMNMCETPTDSSGYDRNGPIPRKETMDETVTLSDFVRENAISLVYRKVARNPHINENMDHYRVTLHSRTKTMTVYFSKGFGLKGEPPTVEEVLDCLALDATGIENNRNFADWQSEYGYDPDSRTAEKIYKVCLSQARRLRNFLGVIDYKTLLWNCHRL